MAEKNPSMILNFLDTIYDRVIDGLPGIDSAEKLAYTYMTKPGTADMQVDSLIRSEYKKAATSGFVTGLGGAVTLPIAIPANLASVIFIQLRMVGAIAKMGGYNIRDPKVKSLVYLTLAGNVVKDVLQEVGINLGIRLTNRIVAGMSDQTIRLINKRVGYQLVTKYGGKGSVNLSKMVPIMGGLVGGTIDFATTRAIGKLAKNSFLPKEEKDYIWIEDAEVVEN